MDIDNNGYTDYLLIAAPMFYRDGWERGRVYVYSLGPQVRIRALIFKLL